MATEIIMPKLGQTMEEGTIVEWFVKEGDQVKKGDVLFKFESDKAALEAEAPVSGTVRKIISGAGATVPILKTIGVIGEPDEDISEYLTEPGVEGKKPAPKDQDVVGESEEAVAVPAMELAAETGAAVSPHSGERLFASPRARRAARKANVDLSRLAGSGLAGRVVEADVLEHLSRQPKLTPAARQVIQERGWDTGELPHSDAAKRIKKADLEIALQEPAEAPPAAAQVVPMAGVRAIIAQRMSESAHTVAAVTLTTEADATRLVELREDFKRSPLPGDIVPAYNDLLVIVAGRALQEHPNMNARLVDDHIERLEQINIGLAVDTERGLLVPVVRDVSKKRLAQISQETRELVARALAGQSQPDDLSGGTFTITNLGASEIDAFTPIINLPECAILGVGRIVDKAVVVEGTICVRAMVALSLTFDHRIIDGAPAARFLQRIKHIVEKPTLLLT